jgi:hypothetical protein
MRIRLLSIASVLTLLSPSLSMSQTANRQEASKPHHTIVPLQQEGLTVERILKLSERGFEIVSGDPDKAGAPFVIRHSSCVLVGPTLPSYPVFGRYCSQIVPKAQSA